MSSVPSVEPSLTITHLTGRIVCPITDLIVSSINMASFRAGEIKTYTRWLAGIPTLIVGIDTADSTFIFLPHASCADSPKAPRPLSPQFDHHAREVWQVPGASTPATTACKRSCWSRTVELDSRSSPVYPTCEFWTSQIQKEHAQDNPHRSPLMPIA